jgi:hypothetical protein
MKYDKLPAFPFIVGYTTGIGVRYYAAVSKNETNGKLTLITLSDGDTSNVYKDNMTEMSLLSDLNNSVAILGSAVKADPSPLKSLKIEVESSALDATLETAKELEATLLRVKALMP